MKYEVAMQWADSLESGKYKQGQNFLRSASDEYCCLGVLCDISGIGQWEISKSKACFSYKTSGTGVSIFPPDDIINEWAKIQSADIILAPHDHLGAIFANDIERLTFSEIAALIRQNWETI